MAARAGDQAPSSMQSLVRGASASPASSASYRLLRHEPNTLAEFVAATSDREGVELSHLGLYDAEQNHRPLSRPRSLWRWWTPAYAADYAAIIVLGALWFATAPMKPFEHDFVPTNPDIALPMRPSIVSSQMLVVVSFIVPLTAAVLFLAILFAVLVARRTIPASTIVSFIIRDLHAYTLGLLLAITVTAVITDVTKNWVGRLRPDFLARCQYNASLAACTGDPTVIEEGRRSFPSGHSSESFAGNVFFSLFLASIWARVFDVDHGSDGFLVGPRARIWRITLPIAPLFLAAYVAISRLQQNIHNPTDVIAGSILGTAVAFLSFFYYYRAPLPTLSAH